MLSDANVLEENIHNLTVNIHRGPLRPSPKELGKARKRKQRWKDRWWLTRILDLYDRRRSRKKARKDGFVATQKSSEVNQEIRRKIKPPSDNWNTDRCEEIDSPIKTRHIDATLNTLNVLTQWQRTKLVQNTKGHILRKQKAVYKWRTVYYTELFKWAN